MLQFGKDDLRNKYQVQKDTVWSYEPDIYEYPEKDYDVAIVLRPVNSEEANYLYLYVRAYCLFVADDVLIDESTQWIINSKNAEIISTNKLKTLLEQELNLYFPKPYGEKFRPSNFEISPNYTGEIKWNGFSGVELSGDYGNTFKQIAFWRNTIPIEAGQYIDFWLEYEKDDTVEIQLTISQIASGSISTVENVRVFNENDLKDIIVVGSEKRCLVFPSISVKGNGKLKIIALHDRYSRNGKGHFIPGGQRKVSSSREELFWYFDPADMKPPLNVYFSGYKTQEGFEGYYMLRNMGAPYLLISEPRLEGGAFYLGDKEYENFIVEIIKECLERLGFDRSQLILSGLSMGTFGALYYGCDLRPHAIILGKPLASLGAVAANERINRPGGFPTSLDVLWKQYNSVDKDAMIALNRRFWNKFDNADWSQTKFEIAYMIEDDYDSNAYKTIIAHVMNSGVSVYGKGLHGRHNDNTNGIVKWYLRQHYKTMASDFGRMPVARRYKTKVKQVR